MSSHTDNASTSEASSMSPGLPARSASYIPRVSIDTLPREIICHIISFTAKDVNFNPRHFVKNRNLDLSFRRIAPTWNKILLPFFYERMKLTKLGVLELPGAIKSRRYFNPLWIKHITVGAPPRFDTFRQKHGYNESLKMLSTLCEN